MAKARKKPDPQNPQKSPQPWDNVHLDDVVLKYTADEFINPSCDAHGHSEILRLRVPPQVAAELQLLLRHFEGLSGYRTVSDIIRHAIAYHIVRLHELEPVMPKTYLGALGAMQLLIAESHQRSVTEKLFRGLQERIDQLIDRGDHLTVTRLVYDVKKQLDATPDTYWKRKWVEQYRQRYAHYLLPGMAQQAVPGGRRTPAPGAADPPANAPSVGAPEPGDTIAMDAGGAHDEDDTIN